MATSDINLRLGDIIEIIAPTDANLNEKQYYIDYIDDEEIVLLQNNGEKQIIYINPDGGLRNESIVEIQILDRASELGYARQNNLLPGTWVNVFFGGDEPAVITGKITSLEEDQIEITTTDKDVIYIDFGYQGIPKDIPITKIEIRLAPPGTSQQEDADEEKTPEVEVDVPEAIKSGEEQPEELTTEVITLTAPEVKEQIREMLLEADQLQFGEELEEITQVVDIPESEQKFGIEKQTNDLLDELLSDIPNKERTQSVLNNIHIMIERYKQLRNEFSVFDEYNNAVKPKILGAEYKPLVSTLENLSHKLYWLLPVASIKKKLYDVNNDPDANNVDVDALTLAQTRIAESDIVSEYFENDIPSGENKYTFLIKSLNPLYTPYTEPEYPENFITTRRVNANITAVIDNLEDFYCSVAKNDEIRRRRFLIQEYNLGQNQLQINQIKGGETTITSKMLTQNDKITLKSIVTLPEPALLFSHINLPSTNIMTRSNLNRNFIAYWKLLRQNMMVNSKIIEDFEKPLEYKNNEFLSRVTEYMASSALYGPSAYQEFLQTVIPKTKTIFNMVKDRIHGKLSMHGILQYLEPFMIYNSDISFSQYKQFNGFIQNQISLYKKTYVTKQRELSNIFSRFDAVVPSGPKLLELLDPKIQEDFLRIYGFNRESIQYVSDSEFASTIIKTDYGKVFTSIIAQLSVSLMVPGGEQQLEQLDSIAQDTKDALETEQDNCKKYVLTKHYREIDEMEEDNGKDVYFDKKYDKTFYELFNEYKKYIADPELPKEEKIAILAEKLKENIGMTDEDARRDAMAFLDKKRLVVDGDYCVVVLNDGEDTKYLYYVRKDNMWERDATISDDVFTDKSKLFCNLNDKCFQIKDKCDTMNDAAEVIKNKNLMAIVEAFDDTMSEGRDAIVSKIKKYLENSQIRLPKLREIEKLRLHKYNDKQIVIGSAVEEFDVLRSPHEKTRDVILGLKDFAKRQSYIEKFVSLYTHPASSEQDEWWLYCNDTNVKLLPTFIHRLAIAYTQGENYLSVVEQICADQGTLSDDGEAWVDKYSGYFITYVNLDENEGYTESGFKERTREVLEKDAGSTLRDVKVVEDKTAQFYDSPDAKKVLNVSAALASYMGINIDSDMEFIIRSVTRLQSKVLPSKEKYEKGKTKGIPYEQAYNNSLIILTFCYFLIAIQTSIPSIKTRKRHPGCILSFSGFPVEGGEDIGGLTYVACVADKIKGAGEPWNAIKKSGKKSIIKMMKTTIERFILKSEEVQQKIKDKRQYLLRPENIESIPLVHDIRNWVNFLPPLQSIKLGTIEPLSKEFAPSLLTDIKKGSKEQFEKLTVIRSKMIYFGLKIQQLIGKAVKKKVAILTNNNSEPYLENSCCDDGTMNTVKYFIDLQPDIVTYNTRVTSLSNILYDAGKMAQAAILFDPRNTKPVYPPLPNDFSDDTIYRAFIVYCKFNNNVPISEELRAVCMARPDDYDINAATDEKIELLKRSGHRYSNESLQMLMSIINRENIVKLNLQQIAISNIQILRDIIGSIDKRDVAEIPMTFRKNFLGLLDTFEIGGLMEETEEMRDMKNYLAASNKKMEEDILVFIRENRGRALHKDIITCLEEISKFQETGTSIFIESTDETIFKMINFIKNSIRLICKVFPNMIMNKVDPCQSGCKIPKYWKLSERHNGDLSNILNNYYSNFTSLFDNKELNYILQKSSKINKDIYMLSEFTHFYAPIRLADKTYMFSIFNRQLSVLLFKYYFYSCFMNILTTADDIADVVQAVGIATMGEEEPLYLSPDVDTALEQEQGLVVESEIISGEKKAVDEKVAELLNVYSKVICNNKKVIDYNYAGLMEKIHRSKEKEKDTITDYLKKMSDEEREIENIFKNNKLERWSRGLQKGLRIYQADTYDQERQDMEAQALLELQMGKTDVVTEMNKDIYSMEAIEQQARDAEMEAEAYSMSGLPDDDDYGDRDGDEMY